jgi:hypothetical protein
LATINGQSTKTEVVGAAWAVFHLEEVSLYNMHQFMLKLYLDSRKVTIILADRQTWEREFKYICQLANCEEPHPKQGKRGKPKNTMGRNRLNRLTAHQDSLLAFAFTENVPFSNNLAECDIRCLKTKQKVATNFQTIKMRSTMRASSPLHQLFANIQ